jgi:hypothetical protein
MFFETCKIGKEIMIIYEPCASCGTLTGIKWKIFHETFCKSFHCYLLVDQPLKEKIQRKIESVESKRLSDCTGTRDKQSF